MAHRKYVNLLIFVAAMLLVSCGGGGGADNIGSVVANGESGSGNNIPNIGIPEAQAGAELQRELAWLYDKMKTEYLFYQDTPDLNFEQFDSADELLQTMIVTDKDRFSYLETIEQADNSRRAVSTTFGMRINRSDGIVKVTRVYQTSSASDAEIRRADTIVRIGNVSIVDEATADEAVEIARQAIAGSSLEFEFSRENIAEPFTAELTRTEVSRQTVDSAGYFDTADGSRIGYVYIYEFREKTEAELRRVFLAFQENNVTSLIIDLRDNQGGSLRTIGLLGSLILSDQAAGSAFIRFQYSDLGDGIFRNGDFRTGYDLAIEEESTSMQRVHVITSARTCSASEVLINSLRAYIDVQTTGVTSCGKPYGFYHRQFEEKSVLWAINFTSANANGEDDFAQGLAPTCELADFAIYPFLDARDPHLAVTLNYLGNSTCQLPPANSNPELRSREKLPVFKPLWQRDPGIDRL